MRIMIFCSNPVDGGTARVFYETVEGLKRKSDLEVFPCVNVNNEVKIYKKISNIQYLNIVSEQNLFHQDENQSIILRLIKKIRNTILYRNIKKKNISIISDYIDRHKIDAVLIHNGGYVGDDLCNQVLYASSLKNVKKRIYVFHNDMEKSIFSKLRYMYYDHMMNRCATNLLTVSNYTKRRIKENSFIKKEIGVIYNGMTITNSIEIDDARRKLHLNIENKNVLMIGNFTRNKGQDHFIEVAKILYSLDERYRFVIIGNVYEEDFYQECLDKINSYNMSNVVSIFHGINNASEYIKAFDLLVVTSMYDESFGLISLEAMANSKPVVSFACGGIPEVVEDGRNGDVVAVGDDSSMAEKIREIEDDPELKARIEENNAKDFEKRFTVNEMVKQYYRVIEQ